MKTEGESSEVAMQKVKEEQASPKLIKQKVEERELEVKVEEEVMPCSAGASTGVQTLSTLRSKQAEEEKTTSGCKMKTEDESSKGAVQKVKEEQASPKPIKLKVKEKELEVKVEEGKEQVMYCSAGASTGVQTYAEAVKSTLRSNQAEEEKPTHKPFPLTRSRSCTKR